MLHGTLEHFQVQDTSCGLAYLALVSRPGEFIDALSVEEEVSTCVGRKHRVDERLRIGCALDTTLGVKSLERERRLALLTGQRPLDLAAGHPLV